MKILSWEPLPPLPRNTWRFQDENRAPHKEVWFIVRLDTHPASPTPSFTNYV